MSYKFTLITPKDYICGMDDTRVTLKKIKNAYKRKGYAFFNGTFNLNIGAVRADNSESNKFDDLFFVIYDNPAGDQVLETYPCTTDPGKHYLLKPLNRFGTIIKVPGQYRSAFKIGLHKGYSALEQRKPIAYVRDNNKDTTLDFSLYRDPKKRDRHMFWADASTNIHRASRWKILEYIGPYSAGCTVIQKYYDFQSLMRLAYLQKSQGLGSNFTFTLFEEFDFKI